MKSPSLLLCCRHMLCSISLSINFLYSHFCSSFHFLTSTHSFCCVIPLSPWLMIPLPLHLLLVSTYCLFVGSTHLVDRQYIFGGLEWSEKFPGAFVRPMIQLCMLNLRQNIQNRIQRIEILASHKDGICYKELIVETSKKKQLCSTRYNKSTNPHQFIHTSTKQKEEFTCNSCPLSNFFTPQTV
jgi:hypothetical protein